MCFTHGQSIYLHHNFLNPVCECGGQGSFTSQPNHQLLFNKPEEFNEDFVLSLFSRLLSIANYKLLIWSLEFLVQMWKIKSKNKTRIADSLLPDRQT